MIPKFRAWSIEHGYMGRVHNINYRYEQVDLYAADTLNFDEVVLMQHTGLKDKNGVEIYEGDIIGIDVHYVDDFGETYKERNYAEIFRERSGYWDCDFKDDLDSEFLIDYVMEEEGIDYPWNVTVEGNIYENPELLKEQNK